MATVDTTTVTLTVNGREVTSQRASRWSRRRRGRHRDPRLLLRAAPGAGVGACRMCLCEIEGMPKLQTACTTPAADGMVVDSLSARAREGQDAVLEFLLINHPLDCPVCDKGGECPLQDQTFRYGPGVTRMRRRSARSRSRSRSRRSSSSTASAASSATGAPASRRAFRRPASRSGASRHAPGHTTFEGRSYTNEFSGNVTVELRPVGAFTTSSAYRFRARPWETEEVRGTCDHCAVGCRTAVQSTREGHRGARTRASLPTPRSTRAGSATRAGTRSASWRATDASRRASSLVCSPEARTATEPGPNRSTVARRRSAT